MDCQIKISKYEGPLDLLLDLIEKKKLSINEISLSEVADQFLNYSRRFRELPSGHLASFLVIASTLMVIKSKSLLPFFEIEKEDEESISDLEMRLKRLKFFREFAEKLKILVLKKKFLFFRESRTDKFGFYPPDDFKAEMLFVVINSFLQSFPETEELPEKILEKVKSLEEKIEEISKKIQNNIGLSFEGAIDKKNRLDMILGFLAVLELIKKGLLEAEQSEPFSDIRLKKYEPR
jgi:segregation and condensation protein A